MSALVGNAKRIQSCTLIGGAKKRIGHTRETMFNTQFGNAENAISYKAEADCTLSYDCEDSKPIIDMIREKLKIYSNSVAISLKSGKNLQFTLGNIPEITDVSDKIIAMKSPSLWNKYLKKSESKHPADVLVYNDSLKNKWVFFAMDDVVNYIVNSASWRLLVTGRIKGDFKINEKDSRQFLTYEYRPNKGYLLGANGGQGGKFIDLLTKNIPNFSMPIVSMPIVI